METEILWNGNRIKRTIYTLQFVNDQAIIADNREDIEYDMVRKLKNMRNVD